MDRLHGIRVRNSAEYWMSRVPMFAPYFCMGKHVPCLHIKWSVFFHSYRILGRDFDTTILVPIYYWSLISVTYKIRKENLEYPSCIRIMH
jgi:hypothetical protein